MLAVGADASVEEVKKNQKCLDLNLALQWRNLTLF